MAFLDSLGACVGLVCVPVCPCRCNDLSTPGPEGVQRCGPGPVPGTPACDTSRQSWSERRSYRSRVEQLWLRLWRHRPARGPQGERREKANRVVGPRMERKGKNSASWRGSRAVGVQKVRTREPLQEAAPGGRPGRLGDAGKRGLPLDPGRPHASRESSSSDASTRDRPGGGRRGLAVAHPRVQLPPGGAGGRPGTGPGKEAVWARLGRGATDAGVTAKQSRSEHPHTGATSAPTDQCSAVTAEFSIA